MALRHPRRLTRRRFVSLASAAGAGLVAPVPASAAASDIINLTPYVAQGQTGPDAINNCGPASVAAAVRYSGVAAPSVEDVRNALGFNGPTSTDQWADLLNLYNVPWRVTWSKSEIDAAIATEHVVLIAAWMADISSASDFEDPRSPNDGQIGRYDGFSFGHSLLIVGSVDDQQNYKIHDPNVFHEESIDWYEDGSPKGAYRKYNAAEIWNTVRTYAGGFAIAVSPPSAGGGSPTPAQIQEDAGGSLVGPAGGRPARRGPLAASDLDRIPRVLTNAISPGSRLSTSGSADVK